MTGRVTGGDMQNSMPPDLEQFRPLLEAILGEGAADDLLAGDADSLQAFLNSPHTWSARITDLAKARTTDAEGLVARLAPLLSELMAATEDLRARGRSSDEALIAETAGAEGLVDLVVSAASRSGANVVRASIPNFAGVPPLLGSYAGLGDIVERGWADTNGVTFEERIGTLSSHLHHAAERYYRPLLTAVLKLSRIARGSMCEVPTELGKVIGQCRDIWTTQDPRLLPLIDARIWLLRNAEAHRDFIIDVENETITYFNENASRGREQLGPLTNAEFAELTRNFLGICLAMQAAFRIGLAKAGSEARGAS